MARAFGCLGLAGNTQLITVVHAAHTMYVCPVPHCKDRDGFLTRRIAFFCDVGQCTMWGGGRLLHSSVLQALSSGGGNTGKIWFASARFK